MPGRWVLPAVAAGAVALVAVGAVVGLGRRDREPAAAAPGPTATEPADLLVRDGDRVTASGRVVALPGRPVRLCAPTAQPAIGYLPGHAPPPAYCESGVTVRGLDLDRIADRTVDRGVVTGRVRVEGTYRGGVVTVERQAPPDREAGWLPTVPRRPPCPAPAGGWRPGPVDLEPLAAYLRAHPDEYVDLWLSYPDGTGRAVAGGTPEAAGGTPEAAGGTPEAAGTVPVVGTVLDPAAAERALRAVHRGNLCVVRARHSGATLQRVADRVTADQASWTGHGVFETAPDVVTGTVNVRLVVLDTAAKRWLDRADDGTGAVVAHPWVRPVR